MKRSRRATSKKCPRKVHKYIHDSSLLHIYRTLANYLCTFQLRPSATSTHEESGPYRMTLFECTTVPLPSLDRLKLKHPHYPNPIRPIHHLLCSDD